MFASVREMEDDDDEPPNVDVSTLRPAILYGWNTGRSVLFCCSLGHSTIQIVRGRHIHYDIQRALERTPRHRWNTTKDAAPVESAWTQTRTLRDQNYSGLIVLSAEPLILWTVAVSLSPLHPLSDTRARCAGD